MAYRWHGDERYKRAKTLYKGFFVRQLGYENVTVENGRVLFEAAVEAIPRANLWLRTADRIKIRIGEFKAMTFDELFEKTKALPWADLLPPHAEFPVIGRSVKSKLFSVSDPLRRTVRGAKRSRAFVQRNGTSHGIT